MHLVNLTPHPITLLCEGGPDVELAPYPVPLRLDKSSRLFGRLALDETRSIPVVESVSHGLNYIPDVVPGVAYIVSRLVAEELKRDDCYYPADTISDQFGRVIAARALGTVSIVQDDGGGIVP